MDSPSQRIVDHAYKWPEILGLDATKALANAASYAYLSGWALLNYSMQRPLKPAADATEAWKAWAAKEGKTWVKEQIEKGLLMPYSNIPKIEKKKTTTRGESLSA